MKEPDYFPDWFSLKNYDNCLLFSTARDWDYEFKKRRGLVFLASLGHNKDFLLSRLKRISFVEPINQRLEYEILIEPAALSITEYLKQIRDTIEEFDFDDDTLNTAYETHKKEALGKSVYIDFGYPDDVIFRDFKQWLKNERIKRGIKSGKAKAFSRTVISHLHEQRVLPYLDLLLYWRFMDLKQPTYEEIANILYPPEISDKDILYGESIRNVTQTRALDALTIKYSLLSDN